MDIVRPGVRETGVSNYLLYGLNEAGDAAHSEVLRSMEQAALHSLAHERLRDWPAVEVWDGPMCVVRLHRGADPTQATCD